MDLASARNHALEAALREFPHRRGHQRTAQQALLLGCQNRQGQGLVFRPKACRRRKRRYCAAVVQLAMRMLVSGAGQGHLGFNLALTLPIRVHSFVG